MFCSWDRLGNGGRSHRVSPRVIVFSFTRHAQHDPRSAVQFFHVFLPLPTFRGHRFKLCSEGGGGDAGLLQLTRDVRQLVRALGKLLVLGTQDHEHLAALLLEYLSLACDSGLDQGVGVWLPALPLREADVG